MRIARCVRVVLIHAVALWSGASFAGAQRSPADSAAALSALARTAFAQGTPQSRDHALRLWEESRSLFQRVGDRANEADAIRGMALVHNARGNAEVALSHFRQELAIRTEIGDRAKMSGALNGMAAQYQELGRSDSAVSTYQRALTAAREAGDRRTEGYILLNVGGLLLDTGRPDSALTFLRMAIHVLQERSDSGPEAMALTSVGRAHRAMSRLDSALFAYAQAMTIQRAMGDRTNEAFTLSNVGTIQSDLGRLDSALVYYYHALELDRATGNRRREAGVLNLIGLAHFRGDHADSALAYYRQGIAIAAEINDRNQIGRLMNNIGEVHGAAGRFDSALVDFAAALRFRREVNDRPGEALTLANVAFTHQALGRADSALVYFQRALAVNREIGNPLRQAENLGRIGSYWHRSKATPRIASAYYDSAAAILGVVARQAGGDLNWLSFAERDVGLFEEWALALLARRSELGGDASGWAALAAVERGRAQALLHLLRTDGAGSDTTPGADMIAEGRRLADLVRKSGGAVLSYLATNDTLITWLALPSGAIHVARQPLSRDSLTAAIGALRGRLAGAEQLGGNVRGMTTLEAPSGSEVTRVEPRYSFEQIARDLSDVLIPAELRDFLPVGGGLVIVPSGSLALVPFAALPLGGEIVLGARYSIRYAPSIRSLGAVEARGTRAPGRPAANRALVVGDPTMPRVRNRAGAEVLLDSLPGARAESRWIAARLGTTELLGASATETAVRARLRDAPIVHLATHGFAYSSNGRVRDSFIALAPDASNDGLLTVGEVLDDLAGIPADLVVLSACDTGLGNMKQAEGTVGLQRAFLARGARSVLVSLWSVSDETTSALMKGFYTHWLEDRDKPTKSEALRRAQADVRRVAGWEHPRFWAAFQLVGAE